MATQGLRVAGGGGWRAARRDRAALARQTAQLLHALGGEPVEVAGALAEAGVLGRPADARQCALAVYLRAVMSGDNRVGAVRVLRDRVVVVSSPGRLGRRVVVPMPPAARAFVTSFDAQRYPALLRRRGSERAPAASPGAPGDVAAGQAPVA